MLLDGSQLDLAGQHLAEHLTGLGLTPRQKSLDVSHPGSQVGLYAIGVERGNLGDGGQPLQFAGQGLLPLAFLLESSEAMLCVSTYPSSRRPCRKASIRVL
jgi:hypothetical protein